MMRMKKVCLIVGMFCANITFANTYECNELNSKPHLETNSISKTISFETSSPSWFQKSINMITSPSNLSKKPFLFYYVIDSEEPFMQIAVKYEIEKLKEECSVSED